MSRRRNRNTNKAKKSNFVGRVAMVIKEGDKNKGQRVAIKAVNNDIAEVFLLSDANIKPFYLPIDGLHIYSQERSTEYYTEDIIKTFFGFIKDVLVKDVSEISKEKPSNSRREGRAAIIEPSIAAPQEPSDDSADNFLKHILEATELFAGCSKFCRDYKVSPIYFISKLSEHLYCMHERYAPKDKK